VFENRSTSPDFVPMWGFACFIEELGIMFDTGSNYKILKHNMKMLNIYHEKISSLFLSHFHWDHTGGALDLCMDTGNLDVFLLSSFSSRFVESLKLSGCKTHTIDAPTRLCTCISTGILDGVVPEHGLIVPTPEGFVLITGCAHPGIIAMVERAMELTKERLFGILGGFHLFNATPHEILEIAYYLDEVTTGFVAPCHCTGENALSIFRQRLKGKFLEVKCGTEVLI